MDDDHYDFADDFDLDGDDLFADDDAAVAGGDAALSAGALDGDIAAAAATSSSAAAAAAAAVSSSSSPLFGQVTAADDDELVPAVIENVQQYLPHVAPDAFPVIVAVLAQAHLNVGIDLCALSCATRNVEYVPTRRIVAATLRLHEPNAVVLVRNSGSLNIIGAASISEARQAAELAARIIRKALNLDFDTIQFRVRSLMARFNACSPVRLDDLARHRLSERDARGLGGVYCSYEPERFSGCNVRLVGSSRQNLWSVTCTVFVTGKVSFLGARSEDELRFAFDALVPILSRYIAPVPPS